MNKPRRSRGPGVLTPSLELFPLHLLPSYFAATAQDKVSPITHEQIPHSSLWLHIQMCGEDKPLETSPESPKSF